MLDKEHREIRKVAIPAFFYMLLGNLLQISNAVFIGQAGAQADEIAGIGVGNTFCSIACMAFIVGMNNSVETLVAQSYGAKEYHLAGLHLKRGRLIVSITSLPFLLVLYFSKEIFLGIGLEEGIAHYSGEYCQNMVLAMALFCHLDLQR